VRDTLEYVHAVRRAVDIIHCPIIRAPGDAIAHGDAVEHLHHAVVTFEAVERTGGTIGCHGHGACPEAALAVAGTVIHAVARYIGFHLDEHLHGTSARIQEAEAGAQREHQATRLA
jgi:hypothetical protein